MGTAAKGASRYFVQSLERGLAVIRTFDADSAELTLSEVARSTGIDRAAVRRLLLTLTDLGYVRSSSGGRFRLTPRILDLGYSYLSSISLPEVAQPHLERLVAEVRESSSVAVLNAGDIVYVARVPTSRIMTVAINVGTRFPAYATSMGRVLLAGLPDEDLDDYLDALRISKLASRTVATKSALRKAILRARAQGWAVVDQELEDGLRSVAAPIRERDGTTVAAINVSTQAGRTSLRAIERDLLPALLAAARNVEEDLRTAPTERRLG